MQHRGSEAEPKREGHKAWILMSLRWLRVRLRRVGVSGTARSTLCCVTKHSLTCEQRILILQPRLKRRWVQFSHQRSYDGMSPLKLEINPYLLIHLSFFHFIVSMSCWTLIQVDLFCFFSNFGFMGIFDVALLFASVVLQHSGVIGAREEMVQRGQRRKKKKKAVQQCRLKQRWYPLRKPLRSPAQQLLMETRWRRMTERAAVSGYIPFPLGKLPPQTINMRRRVMQDSRCTNTELIILSTKIWFWGSYERYKEKKAFALKPLSMLFKHRGITCLSVGHFQCSSYTSCPLTHWTHF